MLSSAVGVLCYTKVFVIFLWCSTETAYRLQCYTRVPAIYPILLKRNRVVEWRVVWKLPILMQ